MKTTLLREVTLYRYRYIVGYLGFGLLLFALLLLAIDYVPRGLSAAEMESAVTSVNVNVLKPTATNVINAPYHLLQKASIQFFGLTPVAIKLPSIIIAAITGVAIILMLQKWFRRNVAIITAVIIVTSVGFLTLARTGTPDVMTAFWTVVLLLGATHVLHGHRHRFFWKLFCFISVALLAYSPFGIYPLLGMVIAGIFHPHVRNRLRRGTWWQHGLIVIIVLVLLTPLIAAVASERSLGMVLLGLERTGTFNWQTVPASIINTVNDLFNFMRNKTGIVIFPLFGIGTTVLLLLGILKLFTARYSARSYMLFIWGLVLIPVLIVRPDMILLIMIPATLVLAIGVETLIRQWYDLFPRNPYARIAALVPLAIFVVSTVGIDMQRYFYGHQYTPDVRAFHDELPAVRDSVRRLGNESSNRLVSLRVPESQTAFYDLLRREYPSLRINKNALPASTPRIVLADAATSQATADVPDRILTNDLSGASENVLLRVYN